jgi:hypothetical protein
MELRRPREEEKKKEKTRQNRNGLVFPIGTGLVFFVLCFFFSGLSRNKEANAFYFSCLICDRDNKREF